MIKNLPMNYGGRLIHLKNLAKSGKFTRQNVDESNGFFCRALVSSASCDIEHNAMVTIQACL